MRRKIKSIFWDFPCPSNLNLWWTFGSIRGLCLVIQIFTGLMLSLYYQPDVWNGHYRVLKVAQEAYAGWVYRGYHIIGARFFFVTVYLHMARRFYYGGYEKTKVWLTGLVMLLVLMAIAFLGYVLPWGQIRYWGCTVITRLFSVIPNVGQRLVEFIWGGPSVNDHTLKRFFVAHILLPFSLVLLVLLHLHFLHQVGSRNPIGCLYTGKDIPFAPHYFKKDIVACGIIFLLIRRAVFFCPYRNRIPENWMEANPMLTPEHIEPEWYFLWLYAILRSIPTKGAGVATIFGALAILIFLPLVSLFQEHKGLMAYPLRKGLFFFWVLNLLYLTYLGAHAVQVPTAELRVLHMHFYYIYVPLLPFLNAIRDEFVFLKRKKYRALPKKPAPGIVFLKALVKFTIEVIRWRVENIKLLPVTTLSYIKTLKKKIQAFMKKK